MDLRVGVTETLNADLTFHTDFAQVEADQEVVNLTRFNLFFPEKRQFFTESGGHVQLRTPRATKGDRRDTSADPGLLSLFYSRSIGLSPDGREIPLIGGGRIAGNVGPVHRRLHERRDRRNGLHARRHRPSHVPNARTTRWPA